MPEPRTRRRLLRDAGIGAGALTLGPGVAAAAAASTPSPAAQRSVAALERRTRSRFASNGGVRLHYEIAGDGPLVLFVHGFPGWWWTWRYPMAALADGHTVAAMDTRGYNLSDKPEGVAAYSIVELMNDIRAVIQHAGFRRATVVGHDWGGGTAWALAWSFPEVVERLVILNVLHPWALSRELFTNPAQRQASSYAQEFRKPDAAQRPFPPQLGSLPMTPESLAAILAPPGSPDYPRHLAAMRRTSLPGALNYYGANYPAEPYAEPGPPPPKVQAPTLVLYGREDPYLLVDGLNATWDLVEASVQLDVIAGAGHFVETDARATVIGALKDWLGRTPAG